MTPEQYHAAIEQIVVRFVKGDSIAELAAFYALRESSVEDIIRKGYRVMVEALEELERPLIEIAES